MNTEQMHREGTLPNKTVLFADDSLTMRLIMAKTFAGEPFAVETVPSGEAAIMKAKELRPSIIIADAGMAGVSGYDVCKAVREDSELSRTPFIIMSGVSHPYDESRGKKVGIDEYIKKPFDTTLLLEKVAALMSPDTSTLEAKDEPKPDSPPTERRVSAATPASKSRATVETVSPPIERRPSAPIQTSKIHVAEPGSPPIEQQASVVTPKNSPIQKRPRLDHPAQPLLPNKRQEQEKKAPAAEVIALVPTREKTPQKVDLVESVGEVSNSRKGSCLPIDIDRDVKERIRLATKTLKETVDELRGEQIKQLQSISREIIERVVWEIVPDLAEAIIKEELAKLLEK